MKIFPEGQKIKDLKKYKTFFIYTIFILIALGIRVFMLSISDNGWGADPDERIRISYIWLNWEGSRPFFPSRLWLPLHFYLIAISIKIFGNIPLSPRLLHVVFGVLTILPFYGLIRMIFSQRIAFISTLLFIFYPVHILCSVVTLSEGPFLFFLITSLYYFFRYRKTQDSRLLLLSGIFLILSSLIRYEGWLAVLIMSGLLLMDKKFKYAAFVLYSSSIFPITWLILKTNPLYRVVRMSPMSLNATFVFKNISFYWFRLIAEYFSWPFVPFLIFGVLKSINKKDKLYFLLPSLVLLIFFTYGISSGRLLKNIEFSLSFATLLIPFAVFGFDSLLNKKLFRIMVFPICVGLMILYMGNKTIMLMEGSRYNGFIKDVAIYLKYRADKNSKILVNNYKYQSNHIPIYMGEDIDRIQISGAGGDSGLYFMDNIMRYIIRERPGYIVYSDEGQMRHLFNKRYLLNPESGISMKDIFDSGPYRVYRLDYSRSQI